MERTGLFGAAHCAETTRKLALYLCSALVKHRDSGLMNVAEMKQFQRRSLQSAFAFKTENAVLVSEKAQSLQQYSQSSSLFFTSKASLLP